MEPNSLIQFINETHQIWPDFSLRIVSPLSFQMGKIYHLKGENGSGKSSFLQKILVPAIQAKKDAYIVYLQQQMHLQLYAIKAYAATHAAPHSIENEADAISFLLHDLHQAYQKEPKDIYLIADESTKLNLLCDIQMSHCLVYIAHHQHLEHSCEILFQGVDTSHSEIYPNS